MVGADGAGGAESYLGELLLARISTVDQIRHVGRLTLPKRFAANMMTVLLFFPDAED